MREEPYSFISRRRPHALFTWQRGDGETSRGVLLIALLSVVYGCPHVLSIDYVPTNPYRGHGSIHVERFEYLPSARGEVGPRQLESNSKGIDRLYLSQEVDEFFTGAVKQELAHSGYELSPLADLKISGTIERFYYDPVDARKASLELTVRYVLRSGTQEIHTQATRAFQTTPKSLLGINHLIHAATGESIQAFFFGVREAKVLPPEP